MKYKVEVHFSFNHLIKHTSHVLMGLLQLQANNKLDLAWTYTNPHDADGSIVCATIHRTSGAPIKLAFDIDDKSNKIVFSELEKCDIYFKRSYYRPDLVALQPHQLAKIVPYGMHLPTTSRKLNYIVLSKALSQIIKRSIFEPRYISAQVKVFSNSYQQFVGLPRIHQYTQEPTDNLLSRVFFQTRTWSQDEVGIDDAEEINQGRVQLIRELKRHFKDRFIGGLIPTSFAKKHFPDCITPYSTLSQEYIKLSKENLIGIYTRGLHHSIALKLPEYLAATQCIVTEEIRNELPEKLVEENNILTFHNVEECIKSCERLLTDKELSQSMRHQNHMYFMKNIYPENKILSCIRYATERASNQVFDSL